jgi:hypothetical protein
MWVGNIGILRWGGYYSWRGEGGSNMAIEPLYSPCVMKKSCSIVTSAIIQAINANYQGLMGFDPPGLTVVREWWGEEILHLTYSIHWWPIPVHESAHDPRLKDKVQTCNFLYSHRAVSKDPESDGLIWIRIRRKKIYWICQVPFEHILPWRNVFV